MNQSNHFSSTSNRYKDKVYFCVKSLMEQKLHGMIWRGKREGRNVVTVLQSQKWTKANLPCVTKWK